MNNSTTACVRTPFFLDLSFYTNYVAYNILTPIYFVFSFSGNGILLLAFLKQLKSERAYMYQVYSATTRTIEVVARSILYIDGKVFSTVTNAVGSDSFQVALRKCYACAWYICHLGAPLSVSITTLSLFLTVAMAADRVLSLLKPMLYKNMRHWRNQTMVLIGSILISFSASAFDTMRGSVASDNEGNYEAALNTAYMSSPFVHVLALVRVLMQGVVAVLLVAVSVALCYFYRTRFVNMKAKFTSSTDQTKAKEDERALIVITLVECSMTIMSIYVMLAYYTFTYCYPIEFGCWKSAASPVHDICRMVIDISNFYAVLGVSKKFRQMVKELLGSWFRKDSRTTKVVSITSNQTR